MNRIGISSIILLFFNLGCTEKAPISGYIIPDQKGIWADKIYLIQPRSLDELATSFTGILLDSAIIRQDGHFSFANMPDAPEPILLHLAVQKKGTRYTNALDNENILVSNYFPVIWKNGSTISISASIDRFQSSFSIHHPDPENAAMLQLRDIRLEALKYLSSENPGSHEEAKIMEEEAARLNFQKPLMKFAQNSAYLLPALTAMRWVSPENDYERVPEFLFAQCQKWKNQFPGHPWVQQLCKKASKENLPLLIGDTIPDFELPMLSGETQSLFLLLGDRLTLLDLWASWCAPCRKENRQILVPLWEKHHPNGLEIVGYSIDGGEKPWKKAIETDGAFRWKHASHLQGDDAPMLQSLRLQTIPANFLLDRHGKVLAKNLHGQELIQFVEKYLSEH